MTRRIVTLTVLLGMKTFAAAATCAVDLSKAAGRAAQPAFVRPSYACNVADGEWPGGRWAYRFHVTQAWNGALPQWPSVNLKPSVTDWTPFDRLVVDVFNDAPGGDVLCAFLSQADGRLQNGLSPHGLTLGDYGYWRWVIPLTAWPKETDPKKIGRVHFFFTTPTAADVYLSGFHLLKPGEPLPPVSEKFLAEKVRPAEQRAAKLRQEQREATLVRFRAKCRAAGQSGANAWFGQATSMEKVRPRDDFDIAAADRFSLRLARGEYESLQVFVMPNGRDLTRVSVTTDVPGIDAKAFHTAVVGYVKTVNPAPYRGGCNVATNLPGGYWRTTKKLSTGWWPDPILDWMDTVDVKGDDLQGFWVRVKCPDDQKPGTYVGTLAVSGEGWRETFPFTVRVYDFAVPKKSPLPLAITFAPSPHTQYATPEDTALAKRLRADPAAPVNAWRKHRLAWGDFLADYYLTMDSLYHGGMGGIAWDVLVRLKAQGRLGVFNFGYWSYPHDMKPETLAAWTKKTRARFDPVYKKAKDLGLLDHAYLYGCDEISPQYFPNIAWALARLKEFYPEVPRFTTAYDHDFGINGSKLDQMNWFTPTTTKYAENFAKVAPSRAAGHQVWWYIACGPRAPYANMFVEYTGIEARQLMGAQTVKWRPDGFLYYQTSIWNALRPISGASAFTDWEPRSWTTYHGDGSWFCCGPEGRPCATIRMENFRDGLEDFAYAQEYERRTGRRCDVPVEVCREIGQFSEDPAVYARWRDGIAEAIEAAGTTCVGYVGASSGGKPGSLKVVAIDSVTGAIAEKGTLDVADAIYMAVNKARTRLYVACSDPAFGARGTNGCVAVYALEASGLPGARLDAVATTRGAPCHLSLAADETRLVFAEYDRGTAGWVNLKADGTFAKETLAVVALKDPVGPDKRRQDRSHCHCACVTPDGKYTCIVDLGTDRVKIYAADGTFVRDLVTTPAGAGPRHIVFHPNGQFAFVVFEMGNLVTSYRYRDGVFTPVRQCSLLPDGFTGKSWAAAIKFSPDGRRLFCTNRGHNSLAVFDVNPLTGALARRAIIDLGADYPWDLAFLPGAKVVAIGFKGDRLVRTYRYDEASCSLTPLATVRDMGAIFCLSIN